MSYYRTRTYLAGDWDGDSNLIQTLITWNESDHWSLSFSDAHQLMQARDSSLPCSIKRSLSERLDASKTFVLVVGDSTNSVTKGGCRYCPSYRAYDWRCSRGYSVDHRSFIQYECEKAARDGLKIVVLYNSSSVDRKKCPEAVRYLGTHIPAYHYDLVRNKNIWSYCNIKEAIED